MMGSDVVLRPAERGAADARLAVTEHHSFATLVLVGAVIDAAAGIAAGAALAVLRRRRPGALELLVAVAVGVGGAAVQLLLVEDGYSTLHVLYLLLFVTLPVIGGTALLAGAVPATRPDPGALVAGGLLLALAPLGWWATHVEPYRLRTDRAELDVAALDGGGPIRVGVISDIQTQHIGAYERRAVDRLMAEHPDLILVAGDVFQSDGPTFEAAVPEIQALLRRLRAPGGVFIVEGDVDSPGRLQMMTEGLDHIDWLDDEVVTTGVRGATVDIGGVELHYRSDEARATIAELAARPASDVRLLLAHRPDVVDLVPEGGADLVVAGHTHGGQVNLPIIGPPVTLSGVPRKVAQGGLHEVHGQPIYVSTGVGLVRATAPQVRLWARPSVGLITLS